MKDPVLANPKVRQAISLAIHREAIIKYALKGLAQQASTMLPPSDPFFNSNLPSSAYDPKAAQKILDDAGLVRRPGGKPRFSLSYKTTNNMTRVANSKAIAADLRQNRNRCCRGTT
jgi:ABC-type transport system substrate-binding protein